MRFRAKRQTRARLFCDMSRTWQRHYLNARMRENFRAALLSASIGRG